MNHSDKSEIVGVPSRTVTINYSVLWFTILTIIRPLIYFILLEAG